MSENKYIIDKDSLTGIANAVRDKLGTGEATIDETTGEIIYPEDKGYYVESVDYIAVSDFQNSFNNGTYSKYIVRFYTSDYSEKVEKPFSQIEMEGYIYWYSLTPTLKINGNSFSLENDSTTPQKITKVFDTPQSYLSVEFSIYNKYARAQLFYFKDIKILLKDENGVPIKLVSSGFPANYGSPPTTCTIENVIQGVTPIPFTIDNIQDKIVNYLEKKTKKPTISYEGLSYSYLDINTDNAFKWYNNNNNYLTYISLNEGQKIGFCIGETVSNRLRAAFFQEKTYSNFQQYTTTSSGSSTASSIYSPDVNITGTTELTGDGLLKRFYYTAPSNGVLVISTSNQNIPAHLHIWEVIE